MRGYRGYGVGLSPKVNEAISPRNPPEGETVGWPRKGEARVNAEGEIVRRRRREGAGGGPRETKGWVGGRTTLTRRSRHRCQGDRRGRTEARNDPKGGRVGEPPKSWLVRS
ncbi:hypothetical protein GCM10010160_11980 [Acrocarpospora corrugata]